MLVVTLYLLYTIYEADYDIRKESHFYADLGLSLDAGDKDVKSRFRRLAAVHHPDKAGGTESADWFLHLKVGAETLQDAAKRFAYQRFGPDVIRWTKCTTVRDYVQRGVTTSILPHYGVGIITIYVLGLFGYMEFGKFYRWITILTLCLLELHTVTRPHFPPFLNVCNTILTIISSHPPYLPFQMLALARKLTITIYVAMSQIGPLLQEHMHPDSQRAEANEEKALHTGLDRLRAMAAALDSETSRLMEMELAPFKGDPAQAANLQGKMRKWLVQNTIRADPMVRDALGRSIHKRRTDAPPSARQR